MSDYDPNSELIPPGTPLPNDETSDEMRFDSESPEVRPDQTLLEPSVIVETPVQQAVPTESADEQRFGWRAPEPIQYLSEPPSDPVESVAQAEIVSVYEEASDKSPATPVEAMDADRYFGELTPPEDGHVRRATGRIRELTAQIERYPHTPVNYVVRGEVYLSNGQAEAAMIDFQRALDLAESRVDELPWGYVNAGLIDRAREGLNEAQDQLQVAQA